MKTTYERLRAIVAKDYKLDVGQVSRDTPLEALGIDSRGLADLLFTLEDEFLILLPPEQVDLPTVGDVVHFIDGLIASQSGRIEYPGAWTTAMTAEPLHST